MMIICWIYSSKSFNCCGYDGNPYIVMDTRIARVILHVHRSLYNNTSLLLDCNAETFGLHLWKHGWWWNYSGWGGFFLPCPDNVTTSTPLKHLIKGYFLLFTFISGILVKCPLIQSHLFNIQYYDLNHQSHQTQFTCMTVYILLGIYLHQKHWLIVFLSLTKGCRGYLWCTTFRLIF